MKKIYFLFSMLFAFTFANAQEVIITGYFDSPCPTQLGRTVEIYVDGTVDLTGWNLVRQSNGGGFITNIDLTTLGSLTNSFAYITNDVATLSAEFGISGANVILSAAINDNGDDAFQIIDATTAVIDRFGDATVDGTGTAWEHVDTYYYRVAGVPANGGAFNVVDFTFGAQNLLDNEGLCNTATALSTLVPFGTYSTTASSTPTISVSGTVNSLDYFEGNGPSAEDSFSVSGINLTQNITVAAPANFEVSLTSGSGFASSVMLTQTSGTVNPTTVYVRLMAGLSANTYNGDITASSTGATNQILALTGVVSPAAPQFTITGGAPAAMNYTFGAGPSNEDSIFVEGLFLTSNITITAPTNFEVSLTSGSGFGPSVSITPASGTVASTEVFIRLASGLAINSYSGDITVSSSPAANQLVAITGNVFGAPTNSLVIIGAYDGPNTGGTPKGVELYALADIADLSLYGISSVTNGAGSNGSTIEFTFPAGTLNAGQSIFVASEATEFTNFFGFAPNYTTGVVGINGDDAIELYENGVIIDTFGDVNADGTGTPWDYLDGWAYRVSNTGPDGTSFVIGNWTFSGINQLEGATTNAACTVPYPLGTYLTTNSFNAIDGLTMYPNPLKGNTLYLTSTANAEMSVQIFDLLGKEVINSNVINNSVNVSGLNAGVYIVKVTEEGKTATRKLVIQ
ncbi:T9SS type A sorting domain-containing protein [Flavobacterium sp. LMO8]|uniref:T9SS type A sorting domain-containing protein n=1 Tax=Flavobacterium sp. LMO8 TaxID=2654244 RepID=UPI00129094DF|nr:T9SS type A sorting domain-containing protein [Flavobacterium sp. LMO8]MQP25223.1 T9SS type A sorting domain-containing protein [Flavobacterium sp. LMO8]